MSFSEKDISDAVKYLQQNGVSAIAPGAQSEALNVLFDSGLFDHIDEDDEDAFVATALERMKSGVRVEEKITFGKSAQRSSGAAGSRKNPRPNLDSTLLKSPYRFVELNSSVVPAQAAVRTAALDTPLPGGLSGTIEYVFEAETPILIGEPEGQGSDIHKPLQLGPNGNWVLPGASMRGMIRASSEILSYSRLVPVNMHHRYGLRDFTHPEYATGDAAGPRRISWENLKAGFLRKAHEGDPEAGLGDSEYVIETCDKYQIRIRDLPVDFNRKKDTNTARFHAEWLQSGVRNRYTFYDSGKGDHKSKIYDFSARHRFSKTASGTFDIRPSADGNMRGVLVFSDISPSARDNMYKNNQPALEADLERQNNDTQSKKQHKKRECVFVETEDSITFRLKAERFEAFKLINSKPSRNDLEPEGVWRELKPTLDAGQRIPVFFTGAPENQDFSFELGLTRVFKIGHRYSVADKVKTTGKDHLLHHGSFNPDMVEALFGHVYEDADFVDGGGAEPLATLQRKGRVAFSFAELEDQHSASVDKETTTTVAMAPRASFAPFYLKGTQKDWSAPDATLAGRKRYFPRFDPASGQDAQEAGSEVRKRLRRWIGNGKKETTSTLRFLSAKPGKVLRFRGQIRLTNVTAAEAGLILWALTHGGDPAKPCRHMIGRAKTAGAGQLRLADLSLRLKPHDDAAKAFLKAPEDWEKPGEAQEGWIQDPEASIGIASLLKEFDAYMGAKLNGWPMTAPVQEYLGSCAPAKTAKLPGEYISELKDFGNLRKTTKLDTGMVEPKASRDDRYLLTPRIERPVLPYRD
ncbi:TIGR03986 family CRISPR-associated RAMP protein [Breoghania sp.]|uniref:TIGR03986 family type III CRISPR-associated RAMP protein n=1 Tax=Breoghania sp. TaxID=2065378 RepID=UPI002AA7D5D5|nr:TIGR03986 family CRISPR-associated RAMP protein [Breoghania sp.]